MQNKLLAWALVGLAVFACSADAAGKYWWQNEKDAFGSPGGGGNSVQVWATLIRLSPKALQVTYNSTLK